MKLLLTSGGVRNPGIRAAPLHLLGKPIADCDPLCIPTALYAYAVDDDTAFKVVDGTVEVVSEGQWKLL